MYSDCDVSFEDRIVIVVSTAYCFNNVIVDGICFWGNFLVWVLDYLIFLKDPSLRRSKIVFPIYEHRKNRICDLSNEISDYDHFSTHKLYLITILLYNLKFVNSWREGIVFFRGFWCNSYFITVDKRQYKRAVIYSRL